MSNSHFGPVERGATPVASSGNRTTLNTQAGVPFSGAAGSTVLPASGAWTASEVIAVGPLRRLTLEISYNASAATTTGYAQIIPILSEQNKGATTDLTPVKPLFSDDVWFIPGVTDGSVTAGALAAGTIAASSTFTISGTFGQVQYNPLVIKVSPATANSAIIRVKVDIDVTSATWFYLQAREAGDATNRGILNISVSGGI